MGTWAKIKFEKSFPDGDYSIVPPGRAVLVARNTSFGGLKNVIRLDVNDAEETVMSDGVSDRPGTANGPREKHDPSVKGLQSASLAHDLRLRQVAERTT